MYGTNPLTMQCSYKTPCGWCAKWDKHCDETCGGSNKACSANDVKCIDCKYLELELPYGVCSKGYKGIVNPDDSCGKGERKS